MCVCVCVCVCVLYVLCVHVCVYMYMYLTFNILVYTVILYINKTHHSAWFHYQVCVYNNNYTKINEQ